MALQAKAEALQRQMAEAGGIPLKAKRAAVTQLQQVWKFLFLSMIFGSMDLFSWCVKFSDIMFLE